MIKKIAAGLGIAVALLLAYAATRPNSFKVSRSISIEASPRRLYPLLADFHAQGTWSPWDKKDPAMKRTYSGAKKGVGAVYEWAGNKEVGSGRMEILEASPKKVVMKLDFISPMEGHNVAALELDPKGRATEVTWSVSGPMPYFSKLFAIFCNMDKMIGKEFEAGLSDLKALAEKKK